MCRTLPNGGYCTRLYGNIKGMVQYYVLLLNNMVHFTLQCISTFLLEDPRGTCGIRVEAWCGHVAPESYYMKPHETLKILIIVSLLVKLLIRLPCLKAVP